jgi:uncharacterized protein YyaL (SSP411 family)
MTTATAQHPTHTNRLIHETSPYLRQHAHNPVDWHPWGEEALARARREDKPIFLSIGYSACHWCHVMAHESFEDEQTAKIMNEMFVNIKVDREERPDLDGIYMQAVQAMTGQGGWPMSVWLLPDGSPFYGGTYFPPVERYGMPSFRRVLVSVADAYRHRRAQIEESAGRMAAALQRSSLLGPSEGSLDAIIADQAVQGLARSFDSINGGFGDAPKFPQPMNLSFLLRYQWRKGLDTAAAAYSTGGGRGLDTAAAAYSTGGGRGLDTTAYWGPSRRDSTGGGQALEMVTHTLRQMARGGMYDQLGGGFHRYSVDDHWLVPHFEKMLYDNAQLARLYVEGWQVTGDAEFRRVAEETLDYVAREMTDPSGAFYSAQDADSEGEEGKFFVWELRELEELLGVDSWPVAKYYGVTARGNFEGKNILHVERSLEEAAAKAEMTPQSMAEALARSKPILFAAREQRIKPNRDDKALAEWNGMMLRTFAYAAGALDRADYRQIAERNADFLLRAMVASGGSVGDRPQQGSVGDRPQQGSVGDRPQQNDRPQHGAPGGSVGDRPQQNDVSGGSVGDRPQQNDRPQHGASGGSVGDRPQQNDRPQHGAPGGSVGDRPQQNDRPQHGAPSPITDHRSPFTSPPRLHRSWAPAALTGDEPQAKLNAYLEDYASVADGLIELYQLTFELRWLEAARGLVDSMLDLFWDPRQGGFFQTSHDHEGLIARPKEVVDNATPSGNSVATDVLLRLHALTGEERYLTHAEAILLLLRDGMARQPLAFGRLLAALWSASSASRKRSPSSARRTIPARTNC